MGFRSCRRLNDRPDLPVTSLADKALGGSKLVRSDHVALEGFAEVPDDDPGLATFAAARSA
jgi:hypothetical protein